MRQVINNFKAGFNAKLSDNILGIKYGKASANFDFSDGNLKSCLPYQPQNVVNLPPDGLVDSLIKDENGLVVGDVFEYNKYDETQNKTIKLLIIFDKNFKMYYIDLDDLNLTLVPVNLQLNASPICINYKLNGVDSLLISSASDNMWVWNMNSDPVCVIDAPKLTSATVHGERLFATVSSSPSEVWFSDDLDPTNWSVSLTEAGFIDLSDERGKPTKVVSFAGYLYIFRERGISRLYASGDQQNFALSHLYVSAEPIYQSTIAVVCDKIIFASDSGIYAFNGESVTKILDNLFDCITNINCSKCTTSGTNYYLAVKTNLSNNDCALNSIISYSVVDGSYMVYCGEQIVGICGIEYNLNASVVMLCCSGIYFKNEKSFNSGNLCYYLSCYDDFGRYNNKVIKQIVACINSENKNASAVLTLYNQDGDDCSFNLNCGINDICCLFSGKSFCYKIVTGDDISVNQIEFNIV